MDHPSCQGMLLFLTTSFSRLEFLRNWRKGRTQDTESNDATAPPSSEPVKGDTKKPSSTKKKRGKEAEDTKPAPPAAASTPGDAKTKSKRRRKDSSPAPSHEEKKQKRTAGGNSMSPSSHTTRNSSAMTGNMDGLVLPGSKPANAMMPGYQASPTMGVGMGMGMNALASGMAQNVAGSPFVPPASQPSNANASGSWFMPS